MQHDKFMEEVGTKIDTSIDKRVNGKIGALDEKITKRLDAQDLAMKPVIEAFTGGSFIFKVLIKILQILALLVPAGAGFLFIKDFLRK